MTDKKVAVVTGGTGHVGRSLIPVMVGNGWHVVVPWRSRGSGKGFRDALGGDVRDACTGIEADLTVESDVRDLMAEAYEHSGRIDALVNLVGIFRFGIRISEMTYEEWRHVLDVNLTSVFLCCRHVLPYMLRAGSGSIVNTTSKAAVDIQPGASAYAVAKSGIITLTEALREELKNTGIMANAIMPGIIDTEDTRKLMPKGDFEKWLKPERIADTILSLCNGGLDNVSGSVLRMFGRI